MASSIKRKQRRAAARLSQTVTELELVSEYATMVEYGPRDEEERAFIEARRRQLESEAWRLEREYCSALALG